jgi:hypothetical protein
VDRRDLWGGFTGAYGNEQVAVAVGPGQRTMGTGSR